MTEETVYGFGRNKEIQDVGDGISRIDGEKFSETEYGDDQCHVCLKYKAHEVWCEYEMYLDDPESYRDFFEKPDGSRTMEDKVLCS